MMQVTPCYGMLCYHSLVNYAIELKIISWFTICTNSEDENLW